MTRLELKDGTGGRLLGATVEIDTKALGDSGEFEGYGSIFNAIDQGGDIVMPGAFAESLKARPGPKVKLLHQHDPREVIGKWLEMREDDTGLYVRGKVFQTFELGKRVYELMREGALEGLSIGFRTQQYEMSRSKDENWSRKLIKVALMEVSVVTFPMNELAGISLVKSDGSLPTEREFETWLMENGPFSRRQAKAIIADGYKSLMAARDAGQGIIQPTERDAGGDQDLIATLMDAARKMRGAA